MIILNIEWKHLDVDGETCDRCNDTRNTLYQTIRQLNIELHDKGIEVILSDKKLRDNQISKSNIILYNGVPIEEILDLKVSENYCASCSDLLGSKTYCRTVTYEGNEYEDIPAKAIRQAAFKVLGLVDDKKEENLGCCFN
ncbi:DUF2703 domain-containing protein, partial [Romboutsia sp. 13368]|uniref:DUF2703 domain-containing protein n=1 Tax=Romboutsia sp. 13368 TaxID=2708053 RepID=UPI0025EA5C0B